MAESRLTGFNRDAFQQQVGNVAMANNFAAFITLPQILQGLFDDSEQFIRKIPFAIRATEVPPSDIGIIDLPFRGGAKFRIPGDRDFTAVWSVTCRFDVNSIAYNTFERWSDAIVGNSITDTIDADDDVMSLMGVGEIHQLSRNSRILKSWTLANIWIQSLGTISYDWSGDNQIIEFPATFVFQHKETEVTRNNTIAESELLSGTVEF